MSEFDVGGDAELQARYLRLHERLGQRIGDVVPRLTSPKQRSTPVDQIVADWTFAQLVDRTPGSESPDLPPGAEKCRDDTVFVTVAEKHLDDIVSKLDTPWRLFARPTRLAGYPVTELRSPRAEPLDHSLLVEGSLWHRAYAAAIDDERAVLIFAPYQRFTKQGGVPFPLVYTIGQVDQATTLAVASEFSMLGPPPPAWATRW